LADRSPGLTTSLVIQSIERELARSFSLVEQALPPAVLDSAGALVDDHLPNVA
jgi:hypothetical protein